MSCERVSLEGRTLLIQGENQLLETHYNFECRMKEYMDRQNRQVVMVEESREQEEDVRQKIN